MTNFSRLAGTKAWTRWTWLDMGWIWSVRHRIHTMRAIHATAWNMWCLKNVMHLMHCISRGKSRIRLICKPSGKKSCAVCDPGCAGRTKSQTTRPCHGVAPLYGRQSACQAPSRTVARRMCRAVAGKWMTVRPLGKAWRRNSAQTRVLSWRRLVGWWNFRRCSTQSILETNHSPKKWARYGSNLNQPRPNMKVAPKKIPWVSTTQKFVDWLGYLGYLLSRTPKVRTLF